MNSGKRPDDTGEKARLQQSPSMFGVRPLVTHRFNLDRIEEAYKLFAHRRDGILKVVITA